MQIDTRGSQTTRRKSPKGKSVALAGMMGAVIGAVLCGGGVFAYYGPEVIAAAPIVGTMAIVAGLIGGAVFAFFAAGIAYVSH